MNSEIIQFNKSIYSRNSIFRAGDDFSNKMTVEVTSEDDIYYDVLVKLNLETDTIMIDDFKNTVLYYSIDLKEEKANDTNV